MIEAEHPEICEADRNEAEFVEKCREYLKELKAEEKQAPHKRKSHQVEEIISSKTRTYESVRVNQYERQ